MIAWCIICVITCCAAHLDLYPHDCTLQAKKVRSLERESGAQSSSAYIFGSSAYFGSRPQAHVGGNGRNPAPGNFADVLAAVSTGRARPLDRCRKLRGRFPFGAPIGSFEPSRCLLATTVATADMPTLQRKPSIHPLTSVLRERSDAISLLRAHC